MCFIAVATVVLFQQPGASVNSVWKDAKNVLSNAAVVAGS
jgi:hypothetical protein